MKAIIEIELEMDGQWKASDREGLIDAIQRDSPQMWVIDEDRLAVLAKWQRVKIVRSKSKKAMVEAENAA